MSKKKEKELVPVLRFPEYRNTKGWKKVEIGKLTKVVAGATPSTSNSEYWGGTIPWMNSGELNLKRIHDVEKRITDFGLENSSAKLIPPESVLIGLAGQGKTRGTAAINYLSLCTNQSIASILPNEKIFVSEFLYQKMDSLYKYLRLLSKGDGGRGGLNLQIIKSIELPIPSKGEQQKIADCLFSLDELIAANSKKLEALQYYKRGLMQNLFPLQGEVVPAQRFSEFDKDGEWVKRPFGDFVSKSFYGTSQSTSDTGKYPVLRMGNMSDGKVETKNLVYLNLEEKEFNKLRLKRGDILFNRTNSPDLVGKVSLFDCDKDFIAASYIVTFRLKNSLLPEFTNQLLNTGHYQSLIKALSTRAVSQANINPTRLKEELIICAPKLSEQRKIASAFSSVDKLINEQEILLEKLKSHKKGLTQQLFPSAEMIEA